MLVFFATLANADDWVEIEVFGKEHEDFLRNYLELPYGIPSHDTIQRVFAIVPSGFLENFQKKWNELLNSEEGEKVKRLLAIDGKTQRGNGNKNQKGNHIVSAVDERGFCLGQKRVEEKTNEITAIPEFNRQPEHQGNHYHNRCHGNTNSYSKENPEETCGLCAGIKREPGKPAGRSKGIFFGGRTAEKMCIQKESRKSAGEDREEGVLADRRYFVAEPEERVDGAKEHNPDAEHHNRSRWERDCGGEIFYQQSANRDRRNRQSSARTLDDRKLSLAFRCDISGRWESHIREAGSL